jgi:hypothetical protein
MQHTSKRLMAVVLLSGVAVSGCAKSSEFNSEPPENEGVAKVEKVKGVDQIVLTARAAQRLGIQTSHISRVRIAGASRTVIPYAAVLYDESGNAYTFTSPSRLTYVQRPIRVDYVRGGRAILSSGPRVGTPVVTVGSAELIGTANGVEED